MKISRMDLADAGSPEKLMTLILKAAPDMPIPVPVEQLCKQLNIQEIQALDSEGFEGGLITDPERSSGIILVKDGFRQRKRFTISHELGHFLIPHHMPDLPGRFLCSSADIHKLSAKENDRRGRMEVEANRFASLLLMPPPMLRRALNDCERPDLQHIPKLARYFDVSKEAMARAYAEYHEEAIAIVVTQHEKILRSYRNRLRFPFIQPQHGSSVPSGSIFHQGHHELAVAGEMAECLPDLWIEVKRGERAPTLFEQVYPQRDGFALIMLHLVMPDEDEEAEEREIERSWQVGFGGKRRRR
jgi:Zn-dependent peptidase ImmA (M78 family)